VPLGVRESRFSSLRPLHAEGLMASRSIFSAAHSTGSATPAERAPDRRS
jgi:hypothetical protein